jgi:hypothetical protein
MTPAGGLVSIDSASSEVQIDRPQRLGPIGIKAKSRSLRDDKQKDNYEDKSK